MKHYISNIQRMCLQDGPGIRTTVFLKGCTVHCPWCSNPENIGFQQERYFKRESCARGFSHCEEGSCEFWAQGCQGAGIYGRDDTPDRLVEEICRDEAYWKSSGGGVTFSGGEPLAHMEYLETVMDMLKQRGIHISVETSLFVAETELKKALRYVDFFYVDVKVLEPEACKEVLGGDVTQYRKNVALLADSGIPFKFRVPCNDRYTLSAINREHLKTFFKNYRKIPIEIFKTHVLGESKYRSLGKCARKDLGCAEDLLQEFYQELQEQKNQVCIIKI